MQKVFRAAGKRPLRQEPGLPRCLKPFQEEKGQDSTRLESNKELSGKSRDRMGSRAWLLLT